MISTDLDELTEDVERLKHAVQVLDGKRWWAEDEQEYDENDDIIDNKTLIKPFNFTQSIANYDQIQEWNDNRRNFEDVIDQKTCHSIDTDNETSSIERCFILNLRYQEWIKNNLNKVMLMLGHNRDCQEKLQAKEDDDMKNERLQDIYKKKINSYRPYFKDSEGSFPNPNCDTIDRANLGIVDAHIKQERLWTLFEKNTLTNAVEREIFAVRTNYLTKAIETETKKQENVKKNSEMEKNILTKIIELKNKINLIKNSNDDIVKYGDMTEIDNIDWFKISNKDMRGDRTAKNCKLFWKNAAHPIINNSRWSRDEEIKLLNIVQKNEAKDWEEISQLLKTKRSAFICIQRYQTKLNPCLHTGKWSKTEDNLLDEFVSMFKKNDFIPWTTVSKYIDGRSEEQCIRRWKQLHPITYMRGKWTAEEDEKLKKAVEMFGTNWSMIQSYVPGRNSTQCRERYLNTLKTNIKFGNWSYEEDRILWITVKTIGEGHWSYLSKILHHRTDNMILQRYRRLCRKAKKLTSIDTYNYVENPVSLAELKNIKNLSEEELMKSDRDRGIIVPRKIVKYEKICKTSQINSPDKSVFKACYTDKLSYILKEIHKKSNMIKDFSEQFYKLENMERLTQFLKQTLNKIDIDLNDIKENGDKLDCAYNLALSINNDDSLQDNTVKDVLNTYVKKDKPIHKGQYLEWQIAMELNKEENSHVTKSESVLKEEQLNDTQKKINSIISSALKLHLYSRRPKSTSIKQEISISPKSKHYSTILNGHFVKEITYKLTGSKSSGLYQAVPLPPNTSTIAALKSIYENRHSLLASTGECNVFCNKTLFDDDDENNKKYNLSFMTNTSKSIGDYLEQLHDYQILKGRFNSLFLWPSILASLPFNQNMVYTEPNMPILPMQLSPNNGNAFSTIETNKDNNCIAHFISPLNNPNDFKVEKYKSISISDHSEKSENCLIINVIVDNFNTQVNEMHDKTIPNNTDFISKNIHNEISKHSNKTVIHEKKFLIDNHTSDITANLITINDNIIEGPRIDETRQNQIDNFIQNDKNYNSSQCINNNCEEYSKKEKEELSSFIEILLNKIQEINETHANIDFNKSIKNRKRKLSSLINESNTKRISERLRHIDKKPGNYYDDMLFDNSTDTLFNDETDEDYLNDDDVDDDSNDEILYSLNKSKQSKNKKQSPKVKCKNKTVNKSTPQIKKRKGLASN